MAVHDTDDPEGQDAVYAEALDGDDNDAEGAAAADGEEVVGGGEAGEATDEDVDACAGEQLDAGPQDQAAADMELNGLDHVLGTCNENKAVVEYT